MDWGSSEVGGFTVHAWKLFRAALVTAVAGATLVVVPVTAQAAPPTSAIEVSSTSLHAGDTFTVTQTVYNAASFTIVGAKAALFGVGGVSLPDRFDLVSCAGAVECFPLDVEFRGALGSVPSGESRTVVYTFKVKDDVATQSLTLQHQFLGDEFSFDLMQGPTLNFTASPTAAADIAVSLTASVRKLVASRITYTVTIKNNGPSVASDVRVVGTFPNRVLYAGGTCTRVGSTRNVNCDVASLASGASVTRTFAADTHLLTIGALAATAQVTHSSLNDPVAGNNKATKTCTALTSLIVRC
jgi:uncharacterized repeat protein (TIGR01451 family)